MTSRDLIREMNRRDFPFNFVDEWDNAWRPEVRSSGLLWPTVAMAVIGCVGFVFSIVS